MGGLPGDVGEATEGLENELCSFSKPFRHFTYVRAHSPTLPLLQLRHSSFSNLSVASSTSQLILQPFGRFTYVTWRAANALYLPEI